MDFKLGISMAQKIFESYLVERPDEQGGTIVYDVLNENGNYVLNQATKNMETDFWSLTSLFALAVRLSTVTDGRNKDTVDKVIEAMSWYRGTRCDNKYGKPFNVYAVHRDKKNQAYVGGPESVFDDQIWAAQEFLNAYNLYGEQKYLDTAIELTEYIYTVGNSEISGIYWGQAYQTRHACSNAPFIKLAVMLSQATGEEKYLEWAKEIYNFCYSTLRDCSDDLYCDLIHTEFDDQGKAIANGEIDDKKYSYNSGSMISAGVALYKATGEKLYLEQAEKTAYSAEKYFGNFNVKQGYVLYPGSDGGTTYSWFDLILFKGYYDLFTVKKSYGELLERAQKSYEFNCKTYLKNGFIPTSGLSGWTEKRNSYDYRVLMDHVTNADVTLLLAQYNQNK